MKLTFPKAPKAPKIRLSAATGAATHYRNAAIARNPAGVGLSMRGPRHRTFEPAMATGPKLRGIRLTGMMGKIQAPPAKVAKWLPNLKAAVAKFDPVTPAKTSVSS